MSDLQVPTTEASLTASQSLPNIESSSSLDSASSSPLYNQKILNLTKKINATVASTSSSLHQSFQQALHAFHHGSTLPQFHQQMVKHVVVFSRETERLTHEEVSLETSVGERTALVRGITKQFTEKKEGFRDENPQAAGEAHEHVESPLPAEARRCGAMGRVIQERLAKETQERRRRKEEAAKQGDIRLE